MEDNKIGTVVDQSKKNTNIKDLINGNEQLVITISNGPKPVPDFKKNVISDSDIKWNKGSELDIFSDNGNKVISPESTGTYEFVINNNTGFNLKYKLKFEESNAFGFNMKYKLKKNGTYIVNEYSSVDEISISNINSKKGNKDTYVIEWKWVSGDNDTAIGTNIDSSYGLNIKVEAEAINV